MSDSSISYKPHVIIDPQKSSGNIFSELWAYRELFYFLTWRNVKIRYKQTILGIGWVILQPLCNMLIFTIFFGKLANIPSGTVPYSLFALTGLIPWTFFSNGVTLATNSVVGDANLITKVYFPRILIPISSISAGMIDMVFMLLMLLLLFPFYGIMPHLGLCLLPVVILYLYMATIGVGVWLSALNVLFRDIRYIIPFMIQLWLFLTPIVYPVSLLPEKWQIPYSLNPMVGVVETFRWAVLVQNETNFLVIGVSALVSLFLFVTGILYFRKTETSFADVV